MKSYVFDFFTHLHKLNNTHYTRPAEEKNQLGLILESPLYSIIKLAHNNTNNVACVSSENSDYSNLSWICFEFYGPLSTLLTHCSGESCKRVNSADPDQMPQNVESDQGLNCLQIV